MFVDCEQVFHIVPRLYHHTQHTVGLAARCGSHALGHLLLYHASATRNEVFVVEHLEEYLARYVVGIVAGEHKLAPCKHIAEVHLQKVALDDIVAQLGEVGMEVWHRLAVDFHHFQFALFFQQKLSQHARAWSYFEYRNLLTGIDRVSNATCDAHIGQEVLSEKLFWPYT